MAAFAIRTEMLSKRYRIGLAAERPRTLREAITRTMGAPLRNLSRLRSAASGRDGEGPDLIWALRDLSFEVREGEVVGIIGRNGAGKSTLLKVLSRITQPTSGFADIYGRVGLLLEVGTGFHQELTGRDNIYLSGSILGMDRGFIDRRFDEIVEFAGIGPFLDTPVKRYSSGMYLRLAFGVAAHLEPEVLIVDEVLAVGDAEFQKKCLGRMSMAAREGRTVLFVSHDMNAIRRLCSRTLVLHGGRLLMEGPTGDMVQRYLASYVETARPGEQIDVSNHHRSGTGAARFEAVEYRSDRADLGYQAYPEGPLQITAWLHSDQSRRVGSLAVVLCDQYGTKLVNTDTLATGQTIRLEPGRNRIDMRVDALHLKPGTYRVDLWLSEAMARRLDYVESAFSLEVADIQPPALGRSVDGLVTCNVEILPSI
jgi:lipopolysaccharide transport system ATP-binding protein